MTRVTNYENTACFGRCPEQPPPQTVGNNKPAGAAEDGSEQTMEHLQGKCVLLCVSGGIAAYKIPNVASALRKAGAEVHVVMTRNATEFITPLTFESLTNHRCVVDTFDRNFPHDIHHISLATAADLILIAPAHGGCHRQAGPRHCRRYAHHRGPGGQVQKTGAPA